MASQNFRDASNTFSFMKNPSSTRPSVFSKQPAHDLRLMGERLSAGMLIGKSVFGEERLPPRTSSTTSRPISSSLSPCSRYSSRSDSYVASKESAP